MAKRVGSKDPENHQKNASVATLGTPDDDDNEDDDGSRSKCRAFFTRL